MIISLPGRVILFFFSLHQFCYSVRCWYFARFNPSTPPQTPMKAGRQAAERTLPGACACQIFGCNYLRKSASFWGKLSLSRWVLKEDNQWRPTPIMQRYSGGDSCARTDGRASVPCTFQSLFPSPSFRLHCMCSTRLGLLFPTFQPEHSRKKKKTTTPRTHTHTQRHKHSHNSGQSFFILAMTRRRTSKMAAELRGAAAKAHAEVKVR